MYLGWIPNAISLLRIALIVPILMLILRGEYAWALGLFFFAGFSDGLDGYLATRFNWQTRLGGLLDPVADKLLVAGLFITLAWVGQIPAWLATVVILRDIVIFGGAVAYNFLIEPAAGRAVAHQQAQHGARADVPVLRFESCRVRLAPRDHA